MCISSGASVSGAQRNSKVSPAIARFVPVALIGSVGEIYETVGALVVPMPIPAQVLTGLTTHASPVSALRSMPQGPGSSRDFRLRRRLAVPHLPQGAPNSPRLANLVSYSLDRRIDAYSRAAGIRYTR